MTRYAKYKPTGIAWLPEVPEGWEEVRLGSFYSDDCETNKDFEFQRAVKFHYGELEPKNEIGAPEEYQSTYVKYSKLEPGDIVINGLNLNYDFVSQRVAIAKERGIITSAYLVCRPRTGVCSEYFLYLLKAMDYMKMFHGMGSGIRLTLSFSELKQQYLPYPPLAEQKAIAAYLDDKCSKVDALVAAKTREVKLLKELRERVIADAVTGRMNVANVEMLPISNSNTNCKLGTGTGNNGNTGNIFKPSGIPPARRSFSEGGWLPEVPEGWAVKPLRHFITSVSRKGFPEKQLLSVTRESGVIVRDVESKESNHNFIPDDLSNYKLVEKGDFAVNKMKSWQGSYGVSQYEGIVSPAYFVFKLRGVDSKFFSIAIRSKSYVSFFARFSKGIRVDQWDLSPIAIKEIPFLLPPLAEQKAIVEYIEKKTAKIDELAAKLEDEIVKLKEYRERLVADVVTGQRKVL